MRKTGIYETSHSNDLANNMYTFTNTARVLCTVHTIAKAVKRIVHKETILYQAVLVKHLFEASLMVEITYAKSLSNPMGEIWVLNNIARQIATYFYLDLLFFILNKCIKQCN